MVKDVTEQAALVRRGDVSALELVDAAIARLEEKRELNVLVHEQFEAARAEAARPLGDGPLAGVPFLLKDLGQTQAGVPERMGSRALRDHVASETAWTVERYLAAGLIICGRTNTAEFGNHCATEPALFGRTLNPWRPELSPGGSSGGSAAAVAAGLIGAASGSDGTGSIRMPAACCGLVGLKPRRARSSEAPSGGVSLDGLSTTHALTRSVRDTALLLDVIAGSAAGDPFPVPPPARPFAQEVGAEAGRLRVLYLERPPFPGTPDPRIQTVADHAAQTLEHLGHHVVPGVLSFDPEVMRRAISVIHAVDNAATFTWLLEELGRRPEPDELDPVTWDMLERGTRADRARPHLGDRRSARPGAASHARVRFGRHPPLPDAQRPTAAAWGAVVLAWQRGCVLRRRVRLHRRHRGGQCHGLGGDHAAAGGSGRTAGGRPDDGFGGGGPPARGRSARGGRAVGRPASQRRGLFVTNTGRKIRRVCALAAVTAAATLGATGSAPAATKWLCGPGVAHDPCRPSLSTTFYRGWDARAGSSTPRRDRDHGVACFYVYPTVSNQQSRLATKRVDPEIRSIALYQAARFSQLCRVYAPVYRQATVPALQAGKTTRRDYLTAYSDVENAFDAFLRRIGRHRGFVLLGHSQGSYHLERLIRRRIDTHRALRRRMVSAVLLGGNVSVREKSDRGGTFRRVPTCRRATQLSCVLAFSTFNETPPAAALFGRGASRVASFLGLPAGSKLETACTNPAALGTSRSAPLTSVVPTQPFAPGTLIAAGISVLGLQWPAAPTTFVQSNGGFTGHCSRAGGAHVLRIASAPGTPVPKASPTPRLKVIGQDEAIDTVSKAVRRARAGLKDP